MMNLKMFKPKEWFMAIGEHKLRYDIVPIGRQLTGSRNYSSLQKM